MCQRHFHMPTSSKPRKLPRRTTFDLNLTSDLLEVTSQTPGHVRQPLHKIHSRKVPVTTEDRASDREINRLVSLLAVWLNKTTLPRTEEQVFPASSKKTNGANPDTHI
jgi:hypothetical protein